MRSGRRSRCRGGSLFLVLAPDELLARLATFVPPPRAHALRYQGVFAPNSKHRRRVVPAATDAGSASAVPATDPGPPVATPLGPSPAEPTWNFQLAPPDSPQPGRASPRYRVPWAELLRKVFAIDVLECPACARRLEIIAFIAEAAVARRTLHHLGIDSQAPPLARARAPDGAAFGDSGPDLGGTSVRQAA